MAILIPPREVRVLLGRQACQTRQERVAVVGVYDGVRLTAARVNERASAMILSDCYIPISRWLYITTYVHLMSASPSDLSCIHGPCASGFSLCFSLCLTL